MHASEGLTHWYTRTGKPCYQVQSKNGTDRPTTLRDARKMGLVPSVTGIIGCCAKPALERWKLNEMLHAALTLPRIDGETEASWIERVWSDSKETAKKAAERGTAIHAAIQGHYEGEAPDFEMWAHVKGAIHAVNDWRGYTWTAEQSFASHLGFGGKVDLSCGHAVVDFKTKEFSPDADLRTWDEHAMQLSAYREGLGLPTAQAAIAYVSVTHPGLCRLIEIPEDALQAGWKMFTGLLIYWTAKNKYNPSWTTADVVDAARMVA